MSDPAARPNPILRGERVWLGATEKEDVIADAAWISDAEIGHFLGNRGPISRDAAARFAEEFLAQVGKSIYPFSINLVHDDRRIGGAALRDYDRENGSAEVAIFLTDPGLLGQGLGTDALNCLVDFGFGELRLERIWLKVFDYNERARRSYEKAGFQTDATMRHARFHRGAYGDVHVMSILRAEWLALDRRRAWDPASA
ncbi:MAG TPA: GNAT family protein [Candidatus Dormibacteraeota bacterium]|nr:GNAT family protein [Candidatus Dormibacteraeota bacterium]